MLEVSFRFKIHEILRVVLFKNAAYTMETVTIFSEYTMVVYILLYGSVSEPIIIYYIKSKQLTIK